MDLASDVACEVNVAPPHGEVDDAERVGADDSHFGVEGEALLGEMLEEFGIAIGDASDAAGSTGFEVDQGGEILLGHLSVGAGDGGAVGIDFGAAEQFIDAVDEAVGDGVFELFGVSVDFIPAEAEGLNEEQLDESVSANDAGGELVAGGGELDAVVGSMFDEALGGELGEHAADGAASEAESLGERIGGGLLAGEAELVDGFDVIFHRAAVRFCGRPGHGRMV